MILMCVAIHGDNADLAERQLAELIDKGAAVIDGQFPVYRAWVRLIEQDEVHQTLDGRPREVAL